MRKPNILPISRREIKRIIAGDEFRKRLSQAADITWESGHETEFCIVRDIYQNQVIYGKVVGFDAERGGHDPTKGMGSMFRSIESSLSRFNLSRENNDIYHVVYFHFHPFPDTFDPSEADIKTFLSLRESLFHEKSYGAKIDCKPVFVIGSQPTSERTIDLLLLQETDSKPLRRSFADILVSSVENDPEYGDDNATIARLYGKQRGIQAAMLSFERSKGSYELRGGDYQKLSKFSSNPKYLGSADLV